ncbi:MAG: SRPBCC domain-containing protein [Myxococcaceae bacterium]|nr:SRPBCC domain-containing protein [Myxococcaceae bacterium]
MKFSLNPSTTSVLHLNLTLGAERKTIFKAFTSAESMKQWWLGDGAQSVTVKSSPKTGGEWFLQYRTPGGTAVTQEGEWRSVSEDMLVLNLGPDSLHKQDGGTLVTIELRKGEGGKTLLSLTQEGLADGVAQERQRKEWIARLDRLSKAVA